MPLASGDVQLERIYGSDGQTIGTVEYHFETDHFEASVLPLDGSPPHRCYSFEDALEWIVVERRALCPS